MEKMRRYASIDEYISACPAGVQPRLRTLRKLIRQAASGATEKISYQMPAFYLNGNLVYFAAFSKHIGFFPTASGIARFKRELSGYKTSRGTVQFPLEEKLPLDLIRRIVEFRVKENLRKAKK